jgi:hypothetical protein
MAKSRRASQKDDTTASVAADTHIRPSKEIINETPKREPVRQDKDDDDYDNEFLEANVESLV